MAARRARNGARRNARAFIYRILTAGCAITGPSACSGEQLDDRRASARVLLSAQAENADTLTQFLIERQRRMFTALVNGDRSVLEEYLSPAYSWSVFQPAGSLDLTGARKLTRDAIIAGIGAHLMSEVPTRYQVTRKVENGARIDAGDDSAALYATSWYLAADGWKALNTMVHDPGVQWPAGPRR